MSRGTSVGSWAMSGLSSGSFSRQHVVGRRDGGLVATQPPLGDGEQDSPATRADPLIMVLFAVAQLVAVAELPLDEDQVADVHPRRERPAAASAAGGLGPPAGVLVEAHAELGRPQEDVEQL